MFWGVIMLSLSVFLVIVRAMIILENVLRTFSIGKMPSESRN